MNNMIASFSEFLNISVVAQKQGRLDEFHSILKRPICKETADDLMQFLSELAIAGYKDQFPGVTCPACQSESVTDVDDEYRELVISEREPVPDDHNLVCVTCYHTWNDPNVDIAIDNTWRTEPKGMN